MKNESIKGIGILCIVVIVFLFFGIKSGQNIKNQTENVSTDTQQKTSEPVISSTNNPQESLNNSKDCNQQAQIIYNHQKSLLIGSVSNLLYKNHYNSSLEKCFVIISYSMYSSDYSQYMGSEEDVYDAYDNNVVASISLGKNSETILCKVAENYGCNIDDLIKFIDDKFESSKN